MIQALPCAALIWVVVSRLDSEGTTLEGNAFIEIDDSMYLSTFEFESADATLVDRAATTAKTRVTVRVADIQIGFVRELDNWTPLCVKSLPLIVQLKTDSIALP